MRTWLTALLITWSAAAQPAITSPKVGFVQDGAHALRPAYGLAGNFILGPSVAGQVITQAFSETLGLFKTGTSLAAFDLRGHLLASIDAGDGPALFAFSPNGAMAIAYIASSNTLIQWRGGKFAAVLLNPDEEIFDNVVAIAFPSPYQVSLLVQGSDALWEIHLPLGKAWPVSQKVLPGVHAPVLALPSGDLVYSDPAGIVVRKPDDSEVHIAALIPPNFSLQQMNRDWVQLTDLDSPARFAIHVAAGHESYYQLPESPQ
jgi:hypothetical protein